MSLIVACPTCGQVQQAEELDSGESAKCLQCGSLLHRRKTNSRARTSAFSLAGLILYFPANMYPILKMNLYGAYSESTIWGGCVKLFQAGTWPVGAIVFITSIFIPFLKLMSLYLLMLTARSMRWQRERTRLYQFFKVTGPWAMLDIFLLSVLVAVVKLEQIATILPGPGIVAFAGVVVCTMLATASFDPRLIWDRSEEIEP